jgi:threonine/homoserine/homoserine lactone efflux protein
MAPPLITFTFLASSLVVIMTPGPDLALVTQLVLTRRRRRPAVAAAAGMITAGALQITIGTLGLAVFLAAQPALFTALRWLAAVVLLGMAALALRSALRPPDPAAPPDPDPPAGRTFLYGLMCTGTNPKVGVFLIAFLPQFVPRGVALGGGVALLAAVYLGMGLLWLLVWITLVHRLAGFVHTPTVSRIAGGMTAVVFTFFAVRLLIGG